MMKLLTAALALRTLVPALLLGLVLAPAAFAERDAKAEAFIDALSDKAIALLEDEALSEAEKTEQFRELLLANVDLRRFGRSALGQFSRLPTEAQFETYLELLGAYASATFQAQLGAYDGQRVDITGSRVRPQQGRLDYVTVDADVFSKSDEKLGAITFVLIRGDGQYKIFDVTLITPEESGTFSLLTTQRDEFTAVLNQNNRDFEALLAFLRSRVEEIRSGASN